MVRLKTPETSASAHVGASPLWWRGSQFAETPRPGISSGYTALDKELPGGGWPRGQLIEIFTETTGGSELRFLSPTLQNQGVLLIAPPWRLHPPGLRQLGLKPSDFYIVTPKDLTDTLWALEQALRLQYSGVILAWVPSRGVSMAALRRLHLAALQIPGLVFQLRPFSAALAPSPATLRLRLIPCAYPNVAVHIHKRQGPRHEHPLELGLPSALDLSAPSLATRRTPANDALRYSPLDRASAI